MIRHLKHHFNIFYVLVGLLVLAAIPSNTVFAIADPDSPESDIKGFNVYRNYIEANDLLFILEYDLQYEDSPTPSEDPSDAFEVYLTSTALTPTKISGRRVDYYGYGFTVIYLDPAAVTAAFGLTTTTTGWQYSNGTATNYTDDLVIHLSGVIPTPFTTVATGKSSFDRTIKADDTEAWVDGTLVTTPILVGAKFLEIMEKAEAITGTSFISATDEGPRLNTDGAEIVLTILSTARTSSPSIFAFSTTKPKYTPVPKTYAGQNALLDNKSPVLTASLDTLGTTVFGSSGKGMIIGGIGFLLVGISVLGMIFNVTQAVTPAMVLGIPLVMAGVVLGVIPMALAFITFFFVLMLFGLTFLMSRLA